MLPERQAEVEKSNGHFRAFTLPLGALWLATACSAPAPDPAQNKSEASPAALAASASAAAALPAPAAGCGKRGLPDCPLQAWMKATLQPSLKSGDLARLVEPLDELARHEPRAFAGWAESARAAAAAARKGDAERVRVECKDCHDRFRSKFRSELRGARLF
jgi:hypothetical protein